MNNLHRELAPVSDKAWAQIEEEASRTLKRHLAARRVVDVLGPKGLELSAVGTGHLRQIQPPGDGVQAAQREAKALVELRVPFELARRGDRRRRTRRNRFRLVAGEGSGAQNRVCRRSLRLRRIRRGGDQRASVKEAAIRPLTLPSDVRGYPGAVAQAVSQLRLAGVNGPYALLLGAEAYTAASGGSDEGYPVLRHIRASCRGRDRLGPRHRRWLRAHDPWR